MITDYKGLRIMAMMMAYNEADIMVESLRSLSAWGIKTLAVMDGHSDDGTWEILQMASKRQITGVDIELVLGREPGRCDWLEEKREACYALARGAGRFDWMINVDTDQIFATDPLAAIYIAESKGAKCVIPFIPQFWVTMADLSHGGAQIVDESIPVQDRLKWYSWGWAENRMWRESPDLHYFPEAKYGNHIDPMSERGYIDWPKMQSAELRRLNLPILKHYSIRGVMQGLAKQYDRLERGKRHFGKMAEAWIINEEFCGLARQIEPGVWDTTDTHKNIYDWFRYARRCAAAVGQG